MTPPAETITLPRSGVVLTEVDPGLFDLSNGLVRFRRSEGSAPPRFWIGGTSVAFVNEERALEALDDEMLKWRAALAPAEAGDEGKLDDLDVAHRIVNGCGGRADAATCVEIVRALASARAAETERCAEVASKFTTNGARIAAALRGPRS